METRDLHTLAPGTILHSRYVIRDVLGEGGFGITYAGIDQVLDVEVAVKEYYPQGFVTRNSIYSEELTLSQPKYREFFQAGKEKFLQEARTLAKFNKEEGIVSVNDFFEENNTAYIVMEYLDGINLKDFVAQNGLIMPNELLSLLVPLMEALDAIHKQGLIHRDISPDNIMLLPDGGVKLMDFGAAREYTNFGEKSLTVVLKHGYAPEEQYRSKGIQGPWTDIYALCATIYKCITGVTPMQSIERGREDTLLWPSQLGVPINPRTEQALMKGLAVLQENRYQNIADLCADLYSQEGEVTVGMNSAGQSYDWQQYYALQQMQAQQAQISQQMHTSQQLYNSQQIQRSQQLHTSQQIQRSQQFYQDGSSGQQLQTGNDKTQTGMNTIIVVLITLTAALVAVGIFMMVRISRGDKNKADNSGSEITVSAENTTKSDGTDDTEETAEETTEPAPAETEEEAVTEEAAQEPALPFMDNDYIDIDSCLEPSAYHIVTSGDGEFSFGYPKYMFNNCTVNDSGTDYWLSFDGGEDTMILHVYEEINEGDALTNATNLYNDYYSQLYHVNYKKVPKNNSDGMSRGIVTGPTDSTEQTLAYILAANNGKKNYIMEMYYPDSHPHYDYDPIDYVIDCVYRYLSFGGTTYLPRTYDQFLPPTDMGTKK